MFAAQDDDWEMEWESMFGIPLINFKERWELLAQVPPQENDLTNRNPAGFKILDEPRLGLRRGIVSRKKFFHLDGSHSMLPGLQILRRQSGRVQHVWQPLSPHQS